MPGRTWSGYHTLVVAALAVIATAALVASVAYRNYEIGRNAYGDYRHRAEAHQNQAAQEIAERCSVPHAPAEALRGCLSDAMAAQQARDNTDQDLQAQQDMAYWAFWMAVLSGIGLGVSAVGLTALILSLQAIRVTREIGEVQSRAYVYFKHMSWNWHGVLGSETKFFFRFQPTWGNSGDSPTRRLRIYTEYRIETEKLPPDFKFEMVDENVTFTQLYIAPDGTVSGQDFDFNSERLNDIREKGKFLYFWGTAEYRDIFPHTPARVTKFCVYLDRYSILGDLGRHPGESDLVRLEFKIHPGHNCADDECGT